MEIFETLPNSSTYVQASARVQRGARRLAQKQPMNGQSKNVDGKVYFSVHIFLWASNPVLSLLSAQTPEK